MPLKTDLWLTSYGLYMIELVNQFTADHVEDERLFRLLLDTLQNLCQTNNRELLLRYFEIHLLEECRVPSAASGMCGLPPAIGADH